jgi:hypothetical protein
MTTWMKLDASELRMKMTSNHSTYTFCVIPHEFFLPPNGNLALPYHNHSLLNSILSRTPKKQNFEWQATYEMSSSQEHKFLCTGKQTVQRIELIPQLLTLNQIRMSVIIYVIYDGNNNVQYKNVDVIVNIHLDNRQSRFL